MDSSTVTEIKRHFDVVAESLGKKLPLIAESLSALDERAGRIDISMSSIDRRLAGLEDRMIALERRMERGFEDVKAVLQFQQVIVC